MLIPAFATIHAMPDRAASISRLVGGLVDLAPTVVLGRRGEHVHETFLRCCLAFAASDQPWHLHFEDDACPAPEFARRAAGLLANTTADVVLLFSRRKAHGELPWPCTGLRRVPASDVCYMVGVAIRRTHAIGFAAYLPAWAAANSRHGPAHDYALRDYCRDRRAIVDVAVPSIVQHADGGVSLLGHCRGKRRESPTYLAAFGEVPGC